MLNPTSKLRWKQGVFGGVPILAILGFLGTHVWDDFSSKVAKLEMLSSRLHTVELRLAVLEDKHKEDSASIWDALAEQRKKAESASIESGVARHLVLLNLRTQIIGQRAEVTLDQSDVFPVPLPPPPSEAIPQVEKLLRRVDEIKDENPDAYRQSVKHRRAANQMQQQEMK